MTVITAELAREVINYDPDTGSFIWRSNRGGGAVAGAPAGTLNKIRGYVDIEICGRKVTA